MSCQLAEQGEACLVCRLPRPQARWLAGWGEACLLRLTSAPSPTCAVAHRKRRKFYYSLRLLLVPTTYYLHLLMQGHYKKYILHLHKATNSNRDKSYYSLLSSLWLNFKISPTKVDGEWWNNCCSLQNHSINALVFLKNCVYECISCNACMHKVHALVNFILILACNDLLHLEIWTCDGEQPNWDL